MTNYFPLPTAAEVRAKLDAERRQKEEYIRAYAAEHDFANIILKNLASVVTERSLPEKSWSSFQVVFPRPPNVKTETLESLMMDICTSIIVPRMKAAGWEGMWDVAYGDEDADTFEMECHVRFYRE